MCTQHKGTKIKPNEKHKQINAVYTKLDSNPPKREDGGMVTICVRQPFSEVLSGDTLLERPSSYFTTVTSESLSVCLRVTEDQ